MEKLRLSFMRFMYGRYGVDKLYYGLFGLYIALFVINLFVTSVSVSNVINSLTWVVIIYMMFRFFSKNIPARQRENQKYMVLYNTVKPHTTLFLRRFKEGKNYRFRKCSHCKTVLRLPAKKGNHVVCCPTCKKDFNVKIIF